VASYLVIFSNGGQGGECDSAKTAWDIVGYGMMPGEVGLVAGADVDRQSLGMLSKETIPLPLRRAARAKLFGEINGSQSLQSLMDSA